MMRRAIWMIAVIYLFFLPGVCNASTEKMKQPNSAPVSREFRQGNLPHYSPVDDSFGTAILGETELTADDLDDFVKTVNPDAPSVGRYYIELGRNMGIRGDIAFAQSVLETGFFRHIPSGQNNFAGIGAVGSGNAGHYFNTPAEGVKAQLEHLWAYSTELPLSGQPVDPRFHLVSRGCAPTWEALGGKWAVPGYSPHQFATFADAFSAGDTYGQRIVRIYGEMKRFARQNK